tara:strand:+ start:653 stop:1336 length:684 start_codon:yes stop_codon:yes gene_type:complete
MKLSIIMPIYNEEKTLMEIYDKVKNVDIGNIEKEIIMVDDASKDKSWEIMQNLENEGVKIFRHEVNKGKGGAIKTALRSVTGDYMIIQDGDLEYNPEEYNKLLRHVGTHDIIYGSRLMGSVKGFNVPLHYIGNKALSLTTSILYGKYISDMETCYKLIRSDIIKNMRIDSNRFDFEPEVTSKLLKSKHRIKEVPISYDCRSFDEGKKITWRDGVKALITLLKYRFMK